ncbi:MAG: hypothetical protein NTW67_03550 [Candidatus Woesearchaeota archaeon]|nr:hypothetical protein [Candidatus Woesearchaeota archaeon]
MKQKKTRKSSRKKYLPSRKTLSTLLVKLESCHNALDAHKNFNLAEVLIGEYYQDIPQELIDKRITKSILDALKERNRELLFAAVEAEIERLRTEKVKLLWEKITQS